MQNASSPDSIDSLLKTAEDHVNSGRLSEAAVTVQQALNAAPQNPLVLNAAALVAARLGNATEAESFARRATQIKPVVGYVLTLADILKAKGDYDEALKYYLLILSKAPTDAQSLLGAAEIYEQTGRRTLAIDHYEKALARTPHDLNLFRRFSKLLPFSQSPRVLAALERARPADNAPLGLRLEYEATLITWKEAAARASRGLPSSARSLDDLFFNFAAQERDKYEAMIDGLLLENQGNVHAATAKATCLMARGKRKESEKYFQLRAKAKPGMLYDNIAFNDEFYSRLEARSDQELFGHFPDVSDVLSPAFDDAPIIFLSCDYKYFDKFARTLLLSINAAAQKPQIHMHIMDAPEEGLEAAKAFAAKLGKTKIAITSEFPNMRERGMEAARHYYHAIRFIRLYQCMRKYQRPLWQTDVDGLMRNDAWPTFETIGDADLAIWGHTGRWEPWNQFNASMTGIRPTENGITFIRLVAAYIADFHSNDNLHWGIDQLATYSVHEYLKDQNRGLKTVTLHDLVVDSECRDTAVIWSNGGIAKFHPVKLPSSGTDNQIDSPRVKYLDYLKQFEALL
ncbi:MAG: tetratricopeptide repeat protein [Rhodospirillaceae bacterium]|nr:tetratricopeptide repeat protein [Rhodospirillaceae bacterium]